MTAPIREFMDFFGFAESTFGRFLLATFIMIAMCIAVWTLIQKLAELLGKPIGAARERKMDHETVKNMQVKFEQLQKQQDVDRKNSINHDKYIQKRQTQIYDMLVDMKISNQRWEILDCASRLSTGAEISKQQYDHILDTYTDYEQFLEKLGKTNGKVSASMDVIRKKYQEHLENGF